MNSSKPKLMPVALALSCFILLSACGGGSQAGSALTSDSQAASPSPIRVVSTPNPSLLPLLLAMSRDPKLPVELLPVADAKGIDNALSNENGEALLSMTWVAASRAANGVASDLNLVSVAFWRGFFELCPKGSGVQRLADLQGENLLLSGPVGGGKDGGPDQLFKAALKREGFDSSVYSDSSVLMTINGVEKQVALRRYPSGDFRVYYLTVADAAPVLIGGQPLADGDADPSNDMPARASFMVEPAASGFVLNGMQQAAPLSRSVDIQSLFNGYTAWPLGQLPLGGLSIRRAVLNDPQRAQEVERLHRAYNQAANDLMSAKPMELRSMAQAISDGITQYYGEFGLAMPAAVMIAALTTGELSYRTDLDIQTIQADLIGFHQEVLGLTPPLSFYAP